MRMTDDEDEDPIQGARSPNWLSTGPVKLDFPLPDGSINFLVADLDTWETKGTDYGDMAFSMFGQLGRAVQEFEQAGLRRGFDPNPPEEFLYLSGSADTSDLLWRIRDRFNDQKALVGQKIRTVPFHWEYEFKDKPFDQSKLMQECLPDPRLANCRGVVAILGERIGLPLQETYMADLIQDLDYWTTENRQFRLLPDWPINIEDQLAAVKQGFFPLTGTVFEYLSARASSAGSRQVYLGYIANGAVRPDAFKPVHPFNPSFGKSYTGDGIKLNQGRYERYLSESLNLTHEQWSQIYDVQTYAVKNFLNALSERGTEPVRFRNQREAIEGALKFIFRPGYLFERISSDNPYRLLEVYDVLDTDVFFGRSGLEDRLLSAFSARLWSSGAKTAPPLLQIEGPSGAGKSSLMRAGILGQMLQREVRPLSISVQSPHTMRQHLESPGELADYLLSNFSNAAGIFGATLDCTMTQRQTVREKGSAAPKAVAALLAELVAELHDDARIILAIDQFEEIIDDLSRKETENFWTPFFDFLKAALATGRFGIIYTLESSRHARFERMAKELGLQGAIEDVISGDDVEFLNSIIRQPFTQLLAVAASGETQNSQAFNQRVLDDDVVTRLRRNYMDQIFDPYRMQRGEAVWSTLPLLSMKLYQLYDYVEAHFGHLLAARATQEFDAVINADDLDGQLDFTNVIEELAEGGWQRRHDVSEDDLHNELDNFLTQFVRVEDETGDRIQLLSAPEPQFQALRERFERFKGHRLIVPDGNGRWRLAHEAVVTLWPFARGWLDRSRAYLVEEQKLRDKEKLWRKSDPEVGVLGDDETMRQSLDVLSAYVQTWAFEVEGALPEDEEALRYFALKVLQTSTTPKRTHDDAVRDKRTHMHTAAIYGLESLLERFIELDPSCLELPGHKTGVRPLHNASWMQPDIVKLLLQHGADPTKQDDVGWPPIAGAIVQKNWACFQLLLPYYTEPEKHSCPNGRTLLHLAAANGQARMAEALRLVCPSLDLETDEFGYNPLFLSIASDEYDTFKYFLALTDVEDYQNDKFLILHLAATSSVKILAYILETPSFQDWLESVDNQGFDPLMAAAYDLKIDAVELLLKYIAPDAAVDEDYNGAGLTALHLAIMAAAPSGAERPTTQMRISAMRTVRALLDHEACDPNPTSGDGLSPFDRARHLPEVRMELARHPRFDRSRGVSDWVGTLLDACRRKDRKSIEVFINIPDEELNVTHGDETYVPNALIDAGYTDRVAGAIKSGVIKPWSGKPGRASLLGNALASEDDDLVELILGMLPDEIDEDLALQLAVSLPATLTKKRRVYFDRLMDLGADADYSRGATAMPFMFRVVQLGDLDALSRILSTNPRRLQDRWGRYPGDAASLELANEVNARVDAYRALMTEEEIKPSPVRRPQAGPSQRQHQTRRAPALHRAARRGDLRVMVRIIQMSGLKDWPKDVWGRTPVAVSPLDLQDKINRLLAFANNPQRAGHTPEDLMAMTGDIAALSKAIKKTPHLARRADGWDRDLTHLAPLSTRDDLRHLLDTAPQTVSLPAAPPDHHPLRDAALSGDLAELKRATEENAENFLKRDGWDRAIWDMAPLGIRDDLQALAEALQKTNTDGS